MMTYVAAEVQATFTLTFRVVLYIALQVSHLWAGSLYTRLEGSPLYSTASLFNSHVILPSLQLWTPHMPHAQQGSKNNT